MVILYLSLGDFQYINESLIRDSFVNFWNSDNVMLNVSLLKHGDALASKRFVMFAKLFLKFLELFSCYNTIKIPEKCVLWN